MGLGMEEVVAIYCKKINGNGEGTMFFQDIRGEVDNVGAGNRSWGKTFRLPLKQFGKWAVDSNAATDISRGDKTVGVIVGLK